MKPRRQIVHSRGAHCMALAALLLAAMSACHSPAPRAAAPQSPTARTLQPPADTSYDWHSLLAAPFGSTLKSVPIPLHEVLLFHDQAHGAAADDAECYSSDTPAPRFVGHTPEEYLLCFKQDRLSRIETSVRLYSTDAAGTFAAACASWTKNAALGAAVALPQDVARDPACEGRDGAIHFSGRLAQADSAQTSPAAMIFSLTLDSPAVAE